MNKINLGIATTGEPIQIDIATLVATRLLITASSGGGKSETMRRILEEAVDHIQCIVIDPEGEFSTLREKKPFVLVGEGGETVADIRTAALVATRLFELNASAVCDIYEMRVQERHEWVKRFLDSMVHAPKSLWHPVLIILDEAHQFAPEKGYGESVASQAVIDIANLGRKRGFCLIPATQRLSKLSKNVVEPMQNYLVGRTMFDDQERAAKVFKVKPGADTRNFSLELERLKDGQFIARGRAITGDLLKVQVTRAQTRPPATGTAMAGVVTPTPESVKALLPKLADLPHEAERKAQTEEDLRKELTETKRTLAAVSADAPRQLFELRDQHDALTLNAQWLRERCEHLEKFSRAVMGLAEDFNISTPLPIPEIKPTPWQAGPLLLESPPCQNFTPTPAQPAGVVIPARRSLPSTARTAAPVIEQTPPRSRPEGIEGLDGPSSRVVTALAELEALRISPAPREQVAVFAGYSHMRSKGLINALGALRSGGFIDYPHPGSIVLTANGRRIAPPIAELKTEREFHARLMQMMGGPESRVLQVLIELRRDAIPRDDLAMKAGYSHPRSKGFINSIGRLRTLGLLDYPTRGMVSATSLLFLDAKAVRG